jgi:hypothetical protein
MGANQQVFPTPAANKEHAHRTCLSSTSRRSASTRRNTALVQPARPQNEGLHIKKFVDSKYVDTTNTNASARIHWYVLVRFLFLIYVVRIEVETHHILAVSIVCERD